MTIVCAACGDKSFVVEAGHSLCMPHWHKWLLSREGRTAKRLYGRDSAEPREKRELQAQALMKLFIAQEEPWTVREHSLAVQIDPGSVD